MEHLQHHCSLPLHIPQLVGRVARRHREQANPVAFIDKAERVERRKRKLAAELFDLFQALHRVIHYGADSNAHVRRALCCQLLQDTTPVGGVQGDLQCFASERSKLDAACDGSVGVLGTDNAKHARHLQGGQRLQNLFGVVCRCWKGGHGFVQIDGFVSVRTFYMREFSTLHLRVVTNRFLAHCREQVGTSNSLHHLAVVDIGGWVATGSRGIPACLVKPVQQTSSPRAAASALILWKVVDRNLFGRVDACCVGECAPTPLQAGLVPGFEADDQPSNAPPLPGLCHEDAPPRVALLNIFQRFARSSDWLAFHFDHFDQRNQRKDDDLQVLQLRFHHGPQVFKRAKLLPVIKIHRYWDSERVRSLQRIQPSNSWRGCNHRSDAGHVEPLWHTPFRAEQRIPIVRGRV